MNSRLTVAIILVLLLVVAPCYTQTWLPVGPGINCGYVIYGVEDIYVTKDNSKLLIAGTIASDGHCDTMRTVLTWDGDNYYQSAIADSSHAQSRLVFEFNNKTYAHGSFIPSSDFTLNIINDENEWEPIINGVTGALQDVRIKDGKAYISGWLDECDGVPCNLVCTYDGQHAEPYYTGPEMGGFGYCIEIYNDTVFVGGNFSGPGYPHELYGTGTCCKVVGSHIEDITSDYLGGGAIFDMEIFDGKLYLAGTSHVNDNIRHTLFYYDKGSLHTLPTEPNMQIEAIKSYKGGLYVTGPFDKIGETPCNRVARWDGYSWTCLCNENFSGNYGFMRDIEVWKDTLYIGGSFRGIGNVETKCIAKMDAALSALFPHDIQEQLNVALYPSPTLFYITIEANRPVDVKIYSITGQLIEILSANQKHVVDVQSYAAGLYIAKCGDVVKRFIKS